VTPAAGAGKCPEEDGPGRFEEQTCNKQACEVMSESGMVYKVGEPLTCEKKADIVFLIDGSGSLGVEAFDKSKMFAKQFAQAFDKEDAQISVVLFSGPLTWWDYVDCKDNVSAGQELTDEEMESKCGVKLAQTLSNDTTKTLETIDALPYPAMSTFTAGALHSAKTMLKFARPDAERIVVLLTDGIPMNKHLTRKAARELKKAGVRIISVPIEGLGLGTGIGFLKDLSSRNKDDNTVMVGDFHKLAEISTVNNLVEDVCGMKTKFPMG